MKGRTCLILLMCLGYVWATARNEGRSAAKDELLLEELREYLIELRAAGGHEAASPARREGNGDDPVDDLEILANLDADDESLAKYKQSLLGDTADVLDEGGPNILLKSLELVPANHAAFTLDLTGDLSQFRANPLVVKEGVSYKLVLNFRVQREMVAGLRYFQAVYRKGTRVDKQNYEVGSYGPKTEVYTFTSISDDMPSGMVSRGSYVVKSKFTDDDKNIYLQWEWSFNIKKDWES